MSLTRRELLTASAAIGVAHASGHDQTMWNWFHEQLTAADAARSERLRGIRTSEALLALQQRVRGSLAAALGAFPERTPLHARKTGELKRAGYVIEKIVFESRPQYYVTANVYRPAEVRSPRPAVIQACGHYAEGKASPDYQKACAGLARKGFVALVFDPMGQGERLMYGEAARGRSATAEHLIAGRPSLLVGRTLMHYMVWDAMRALDYLETRPDVDKTRFGMLGHSGGGMQTLLTAPLEARIKAVMSCCAVTTFYHKTQALLNADPEQIVPAVYREGIDHPELIAAAHGPFLIGTVAEDYVPLDGSRRTFAEARGLFERTGLPGRVAIAETGGEHQLNRDLREACYGWMMKHLGAGELDTREPELPVESLADLQCTATGCVMDLPGARGVHDLNLEAASRRRPAELSRLLGMPAKIARERGIELTSSSHPGIGALIIVIAPKRVPALAAGLAQSGKAVMELDLRGWGETSPATPAGRKANFAWDDFFANRAIEMGRPLLGMRVLDLLAVVAESRYSKVYVVGVEGGGIVALHAAALNKQIAGLALVNTVASYRQVLETPNSPQPLSGIAPGALLSYDLPQLKPKLCVELNTPDAAAILKGLSLR